MLTNLKFKQLNRMWFLFTFLYQNKSDTIIRNNNPITGSAEELREVAHGVYSWENILNMPNPTNRRRVLAEINEVNELCNLLATIHLMKDELERERQQIKIRALCRKLKVRQITIFPRNLNANSSIHNSEQYKILVTFGENFDTHIISTQTYLYKNINHIQTEALALCPGVKVENLLEKSGSDTDTNAMSNAVSGVTILKLLFDIAVAVVTIHFLTKKGGPLEHNSNIKDHLNIYSYNAYTNLPKNKGEITEEKIVRSYPKNIQDNVLSMLDDISITSNLQNKGASILLVGDGGCGKTNLLRLVEKKIVECYHELNQASSGEKQEEEIYILRLSSSAISNQIFVGDSTRRIDELFDFLEESMVKNPNALIIVEMDECAYFFDDSMKIFKSHTTDIDFEAYKNRWDKLGDLARTLQMNSDSKLARVHFLCSANPTSGELKPEIDRRFTNYTSVITTIDRNNMLEVFKDHLNNQIEKNILESRENTGITDDINALKNELTLLVKKHIDKQLNDLYFVQISEQEKAQYIKQTNFEAICDKALYQGYNFTPSYLAKTAQIIIERLVTIMKQLKVAKKINKPMKGDLSALNDMTNVTYLEIFELMKQQNFIPVIQHEIGLSIRPNNDWIKMQKEKTKA